VTLPPAWQPFTVYAAATVTHPGLHYLFIRQAEQIVASVIAHVTADMVGIYGISTLPRFRRRGYGTALVRAAVALRPDLPVTVFPDPPSVPMYTRSGFVRAQEIAIWQTVKP
jgi:GNAT superfamily N-acetyltransferase